MYTTILICHQQPSPSFNNKRIFKVKPETSKILMQNTRNNIGEMYNFQNDTTDSKIVLTTFRSCHN